MKITRLVCLTVAAAALLSAQSGPEQPPSALFSAIEVASSSIKGVLLRFVNTANGRSPVQVATRHRDSNYIAMRDGEGNLTEAGMSLVAQHVEEVLGELKSEARRLHMAVPLPFVVGSSGIGLIKNKDDLRKQVYEATEVCMDFISASDEARFSRIFLPARTAQSSILMDLGGGNTKGGYMQGTQWRDGAIPFGSRTLRQAARQRATEKSISYEQAVAELVNEQVIPAYSKIVSDQPGFVSRKILYLYGGAIWATANWSQPNQVTKFFSSMTLADFDQYLLTLIEHDGDEKRLRRGALTANASPAVRASADAAFRESADIFDRESLIAGVSIARAIIKASHPDVEIQFPRQALWLPGYGISCFLDKRECNAPVCAPRPGPAKGLRPRAK